MLGIDVVQQACCMQLDDTMLVHEAACLPETIPDLALLTFECFMLKVGACLMPVYICCCSSTCEASLLTCLPGAAELIGVRHTCAHHQE